MLAAQQNIAGGLGRSDRPAVESRTSVGLWRSLVAHLSRGQRVASSNLASPTNSSSEHQDRRCTEKSAIAISACL